MRTESVVLVGKPSVCLAACQWSKSPQDQMPIYFSHATYQEGYPNPNPSKTLVSLLAFNVWL